jgi:hypothetical protein
LGAGVGFCTTGAVVEFYYLPLGLIGSHSPSGSVVFFSFFYEFFFSEPIGNRLASAGLGVTSDFFSSVKRMLSVGFYRNLAALGIPF